MITFSSRWSAVSSFPRKPGAPGNAQKASATQPLNTPKFAGHLATHTAKQELLSYHQLKELVLQDDNPYLGTIPPSFLEGSKASEAQWQQGLDWLAFNLQNPKNIKVLKPGFFKGLLQSKKHTDNPVEALFQKNGIKIRLLGAGIAGNVYQLHVNGRDFAFKVFKEEGRSSFDAYREASTGLFFTERETRDMSAFYAANPVRRWTLMEFISPTTTLEGRLGKTMQEQGFKLSDDNDKNKVNQIRVDHGGVVTQVGVGYMAPDAFKRFSQLNAGNAAQAEALPRVSVERPENLAVTEAEWDEDVPLSDLHLLQQQGLLSQTIRRQLGAPVRQAHPEASDTEDAVQDEAVADLETYMHGLAVNQSPEQLEALQAMGKSAIQRRQTKGG